MGALLLPLAGAFAQKYEPTAGWAYLYENFSEGKIYLSSGGSPVEYDKLNVSLPDGRVHYVDNGVIMEAGSGTVAAVEIAGEKYVPASGRMSKVLRDCSEGAVVLQTTIDTEAMSRVSIGYGTSSLASTQNLSLDAISSSLTYSVNKSLDEASRGRNTGEKLPLKETTGILYKGMFVPATKIDVLNIGGIDKAAVKDFLKKEKIKFKSPDDLARLTEFLYSRN